MPFDRCSRRWPWRWTHLVPLCQRDQPHVCIGSTTGKGWFAAREIAIGAAARNSFIVISSQTFCQALFTYFPVLFAKSCLPSISPCLIWLAGLILRACTRKSADARGSWQCPNSPRKRTCWLTHSTSVSCPAADIRDDVNEKGRPPCGGLSKVVSRLHAVLAVLTTPPWISERPARRCGSRPAQPVAGRASGRDWSVTRRL
jgi:hypothetical protein